MSQAVNPIRLLVAEDSAVCREMLVTIFQNAPGMQVVGSARNGAEAVRLAKRLKPDVITMDVYMPEMDGYESTRRIMAEAPCPIVMVSGRLGNGENNLTFNALQAGALAVMAKPSLANDTRNTDALIKQVRLMAGVKVIRRKSDDDHTSLITSSKSQKSQLNVIAMAASTGGPGALATILSSLPLNFPVPILIVQHVTEGFGAGLIEWLNQQTELVVRQAENGLPLKAGEVLVAPDNCHLVLNRGGKVSLKSPTANDPHCPSADVLFHSVAQVYGQRAVGIILTGMGSDGARGLYELHLLGAHTIAQDEATSIIYGMPGTAVKLNAVEQIRPLAEIGATLLKLV